MVSGIKVINDVCAHLRVIAGAGTGKTGPGFR